jgi:diguanylate cyclase (GGDEF)-like protein
VHAQDPDRSLPSLARVLAGVVALVAVLTLAGWALGLPVLQRPVSSFAPLRALAALALALAAASVLLLRSFPVPARVLAVAAAALGVAGMAGPLPETTATALVLLGVSLVTADGVRTLRILSRVCAVVATAIGTSAFMGFLLGVEFFVGSGRTVQVSPQGAASIALLGLAALAIRPGRRVRIMAGPTLGGRFARVFLPLVVLVQLVSGLLATQGVRSDLWSPTTAIWLMFLAALASLVALVVWAAQRLHADDLRRASDAAALERLAQRDPLTGSYNRRAFDAEVERAVERARRYGEQVAACVIDLDHFKEINDRHGHAAGDEALVRVNRGLRSRLRTTDVLGRIGGDEFAVVLTHVDETAARRVAREMAETVAQVGVELGAEGRDNRLSASIGTATWQEGMTAADLVRLADERMYANKRAARVA